MLIMYLEVAGLEGVGRICFVEDINHWEVLIFMEMNICCLANWFLASQEGLCCTELVCVNYYYYYYCLFPL